MSTFDNIQILLDKQGKKQKELTDFLGISNNAFTDWKSGRLNSWQKYLPQIAKFLGVSVEYLCQDRNNTVNITDDYTTFHVIGEIAAGYDSIAAESWTGDTVNIPNAWLNGRDASDYMVLSVKGDSMYPLYIDGDKVLILKCSTLDYSGQVGAIMYDDEYATLKKVEYKTGEDWLNLVPINPLYPPQRIENEALEHCRIIGMPKVVIREIKD